MSSIIGPAYMEFEGVYYDGVYPVRRRARIWVEDRGMIFDTGPTGVVTWPYGSFEIAATGGHGEPVRLESATGGTLVVSTWGFLDSIVSVGGLKRPFEPDLRGWPVVLMSCAAVLAIAAAYYTWGLSLSAELAARFMPAAIEDRMGKAVVNILAPESSRCKPNKAQAMLQPLIDRLASAAGPGKTFKVTYVNQSIVNAFAAPGGYVVVFRGIVEASDTPEELLGVLSHEMQHVVLKHATRAVAREFSGRALLSLMAIDSSGTPQALQAAARLTNLSYQRDDEQAADLAGAAMLARAGIDTQGLAALFRKMQGQSLEGLNVAQFLSTHPSFPDRIGALERLAREQKAKAAPEPLMTAAEWHRAQRVCAAD